MSHIYGNCQQELGSGRPRIQYYRVHQHLYGSCLSQVFCRVRCNVITVGEIDTVKQEFEAEIYLSLRWKEDNFKGKTREVQYFRWKQVGIAL